MPQIDLEAIQAKIDSQNPTLFEKPHSATTGDLTDDQRNLVNWFFASMRTQWGVAKYNSQFGEGNDVMFAKRHWAPRIIKYTPEQLKSMLEQADSQRIAGNEKYAWPDPAMILALEDNSWERRCHKPFEPERAIENLTAKEARIACGREILESMKSLDFTPRKGRDSRTVFDAKRAAEDAAWQAHCKKLLDEAKREHPDDDRLAREVFEQRRQQDLARRWQ